MWELSHGLEWVAATGLVATLAAPHLTVWWLAALVFVALSFGIVLLLSVVASATARLQIDTTVRFYWQCTLIFAVLAVESALFMRYPGMNILDHVVEESVGRFADACSFPFVPQ